MNIQSIYFVRHGQKQSSTTYNSVANKNLDLTPEGEAQAAAVGRFLQNIPVDTIITSPFRRAQKTALIANKFLGVKIRTDAQFGERILFTKDSITETESMREFEKSQNDWNYHTDGGESLNAVVERFSHAAASILSRDSIRNAVVFTHGRAMQSYLYAALSANELGGTQLKIESATIYRVDYQERKPISYSLLFAPVADDSLSSKILVPTIADTIVKNSENRHILKTHLTPGFMAHDVQKNQYEFNSLTYLEAIGIKVPGGLGLVELGKYIQMDFIKGITFGEIIAHKPDSSVFNALGTLLSEIHSATLQHKPPTELTISAPNGSINAQCALNFQQHTCTWLSSGANKLDTSSTNIAFINALKHAHKLLDKHSEYLISENIVHGDFKPDNILVSDNELFTIDPHLSYGRYSCDIAKMIARIYLMNPSRAKEYIQAFLGGYSQDFNADEVYHMAGFDILNTYSRLISKKLFNKEKAITSHVKTVDNMTFCLEKIVPALLNGILR